MWLERAMAEFGSKKFARERSGHPLWFTATAWIDVRCKARVRDEMRLDRQIATSVAILLAGIPAGPVQAALAPQWQRLSEFQRVVETATKTLGAPLDSVERIDGTRYRARAGSCNLLLRITFGRNEVPGPVPFTVTPARPECE